MNHTANRSKEQRAAQACIWDKQETQLLNSGQSWLKNPRKTKESLREKKGGSEISTKQKTQGGHDSRWDVCGKEKRKEEQRSGQIGRYYPCCFTALRSLAVCSGSVSPPPWETGTAGHWAERPASSAHTRTHTHNEPNWQAWELIRAELLCVRVHDCFYWADPLNTRNLKCRCCSL